MKNIIASIFAVLLVCCGTDLNPCPKQTPCPAESPCPIASPCPDCPNCPLPVPSPSVTPTPVPTFEDVEHPSTDFEIIAVLAAPNTLGLFVSDPNGNVSDGLFAMPELRQNLEYEEVLTIDLGNETSYDIGATEGKQDELGLIVSSLCEREFAPICTASIITNGATFKTLKVSMTGQQDAVFSWNAL